jgi:hypothetical protein
MLKWARIRPKNYNEESARYQHKLSFITIKIICFKNKPVQEIRKPRNSQVGMTIQYHISLARVFLISGYDRRISYCHGF